MLLGQDRLHTWLDSWNRGGFSCGFLEAVEHFEKVVSIDAHSAKARLSFGVALFFRARENSQRIGPRNRPTIAYL